jgi:hypothetical protein
VEKMVGYCGYKCYLCAARSEDPAIRQKLVDGWRKIFGHQRYTAENVFCEGCKSSGKIADKECKARPCAIEKGLDSCVQCDEFPCKKVGHLLASREGMFIFCRPAAATITREEYELCMRQFVSMPDLVEMLLDEGKLPAWIRDYEEEERKR